MNIGDTISVRGCITKEKFLLRRSLRDLERILGFHPGRLSRGITVAALLRLPDLSQFDLAGYSNVATHRHQSPQGLDFNRLKADARATWATSGFERLVKVLPDQPHDQQMDPDQQYPPGLGVPQWVFRVPMPAKVVAVLRDYPNGEYVPADAPHR